MNRMIPVLFSDEIGEFLSTDGKGNFFRYNKNDGNKHIRDHSIKWLIHNYGNVFTVQKPGSYPEEYDSDLNGICCFGTSSLL